MSKKPVDNERTFANFKDINDNAKEGRKFEDISHAWHNGGRTRDGEQLKMQDILSMWEAPVFIPKIINNEIQEAVEPMLIGTSLLQRIDYQPGTVINLPVMGAVDGDFRVGEEENYPEFQVTIAGGSQIASTGKYGLAMRFTEEVRRNSMFDVVTMYARQAARVLGRFKEEQVWAMVLSQGTVTHDNATPANADFGTTTGRGLDGAFNGSFVMDNMFEMYSAIMANGFIPNALLLHPLSWLMWTQDAQLRHFAQMSQGTYFGYQWSGSPAKNDFMSYQGGQGETGAQLRRNAAGLLDPAQASSPLDFSQNLKSAPVVPGYFGLPLSVIVSPFIPFDHTTNTTSIIMADASQLGFYVDEHGLMVDEWQNPMTDVQMIRMKERYSMRPKDRGLGIAVANNIVVTANQIILPAQASIDVAGSVGVGNRNLNLV